MESAPDTGTDAGSTTPQGPYEETGKRSRSSSQSREPQSDCKDTTARDQMVHPQRLSILEVPSNEGKLSVEARSTPQENQTPDEISDQPLPKSERGHSSVQHVAPHHTTSQANEKGHNITSSPPVLVLTLFTDGRPCVNICRKSKETQAQHTILCSKEDIYASMHHKFVLYHCTSVIMM